MKILIIAPYYFPYISGMTVYLKRLAEGLVKKNNEVLIITSQHQKDLSLFEVINGVKISRLPVLFRFQRGVFTPTLIFKFTRILKNFDVVNIHLPLLEAGLVALLTKLITKKRLFITYHCDLKMRDGLFSKLIEKFYYLSVKIAVSLSDKIVVNSVNYAKESRIKKFLWKTVEIFPPIDTEKFKKSKNYIRFKKRYSIKESDLVVGFVGRLVYEKGLKYLIQSVPFILKEFPKAKIVIVGEGEKIAGGSKESVKNQLLKLIEKLNLKNIIFTGYLPDDFLVDFYSSCNVFVLPSIDPLESFGMVQVEAMLCGVPVVATDMSGVRETITLTSGGIIVPKKNIKKLARAIITVLRNQRKYIISRETLLKYFGIDKTIKEYEKEF